MRRRTQPLTTKQVDLLSRAALMPIDEGVEVDGADAISAQSLRRRGWLALANRRAEGVSGYKAYITQDGREELARLEKRATRLHADDLAVS